MSQRNPLEMSRKMLTREATDFKIALITTCKPVRVQEIKKLVLFKVVNIYKYVLFSFFLVLTKFCCKSLISKYHPMNSAVWSLDNNFAFQIVGKFSFFKPPVSHLTLADRAWQCNWLFISAVHFNYFPPCSVPVRKLLRLS